MNDLQQPLSSSLFVCRSYIMGIHVPGYESGLVDKTGHEQDIQFLQQIACLYTSSLNSRIYHHVLLLLSQ